MDQQIIIGNDNRSAQGNYCHSRQWQPINVVNQLTYSVCVSMCPCPCTRVCLYISVCCTTKRSLQLRQPPHQLCHCNDDDNHIRRPVQYNTPKSRVSMTMAIPAARLLIRRSDTSSHHCPPIAIDMSETKTTETNKPASLESIYHCRFHSSAACSCRPRGLYRNAVSECNRHLSITISWRWRTSTFTITPSASSPYQVDLTNKWDFLRVLRFCVGVLPGVGGSLGIPSALLAVDFSYWEPGRERERKWQLKHIR